MTFQFEFQLISFPFTLQNSSRDEAAKDVGVSPKENGGGVGGGGGADENDGKEGSQEKNVDFEKQRDEALQVS